MAPFDLAGPARLLVALLAAAACGPVASAHAASELFVQSAETSSAVAQRGRLFTLTLRGTPTTVLRFNDRPSRASGRISVDRYVALWRGSFGQDAPNAVLTGRRGGRRAETVIELLSARRIRGGVRYTVRARHGRPARRLRDVSLFVDPITFPTTLATFAAPNVTIRTAHPFVLGGAANNGAPLVALFSTVTFEPGARLTVDGVRQLRLLFAAASDATAQAVVAASQPRPTAVVRTEDGWMLLWNLAKAAPVLIEPVGALTLNSVQFETG